MAILATLQIDLDDADKLRSTAATLLRMAHQIDGCRSRLEETTAPAPEARVSVSPPTIGNTAETVDATASASVKAKSDKLAADTARMAKQAAEAAGHGKPATPQVEALPGMTPLGLPETPKAEAKASPAPPTADDVRSALAAWAKGHGGNGGALAKLQSLGFKNCSAVPADQRAAVIAKLQAEG